MSDDTPQKKGAWVAHNLNQAGETIRWFRLFGSELAARRHAMTCDNPCFEQITVERLTWGEGRMV